MGRDRFAGRLYRSVRVGVLAALIVSAAPGAGWAVCSATFTCDPGVSPTCWFVVRTAGILKNLTVPAGTGQTLYGLKPGDTYCTSNQGWPDMGSCAPIRVNMNCN